MPGIRRNWEPHALQREVMESDARFRIAPLGRRTGKTVLARAECFENAMSGEYDTIWWVSPTYNDAEETGFEPLLSMIPEALIDGSPQRSEPYKIPLITGCTISFRSAERRKSLSGRGLDFLVIDEAGNVGNHVWYGDLRPSLTGSDDFATADPFEAGDESDLGHMIAIGTPEGRNWFHGASGRGKSSEYPDWETFTGDLRSNPYVPDSELWDAKTELPERKWRQQYLGEFVDSEGAVFGEVEARNTRSYDMAEFEGTAPFSVGIDLARKSNYTVSHALDADGLTVDWDRFTGGSWSRIEQRLRSFITRNTPANVRIDATRDNKVVEDLANSIPRAAIEPVSWGGHGTQKKASYIENLQARLETGDVVFPVRLGASEETENVLVDELLAYEFEATKGGNTRYHAPEGYHDDCVDALALAAKGGGARSATW